MCVRAKSRQRQRDWSGPYNGRKTNAYMNLNMNIIGIIFSFAFVYEFISLCGDFHFLSLVCFFFSSHLLLFQCLGIFTLLWCSINSSILLGWLPVQYALRICIVCRCWRWACVCVCLFHSLAIICLFVCYLLSSFALFMNCCVLQPKRKLFTYLFHLAGALLATAVARSYMVFSPIFQLILFCFLIIWLTKREKKICFVLSYPYAYLVRAVQKYTHFSWETTVFSFLFWVLFSNNVHLVLTDCWHFLIFFNIWRW